MISMITQKELKEAMHYNPETGVFTRLTSPATRVKVGDIAGWLRPDGFLIMMVKGKNYLAHRLAWLYMHGVWPKNIDHINHNPSDNRAVNLREVTHQENHKNQSLSKNNTSGVCGVYWYSKRSKWVAAIMVNGENIRMGYFADKFEAICARMSANNKYDFHPNHGRNL